MSPEDLPPLGRLLSLLEARFALRVIWALQDGQAQTFRHLQDSVGGVTPNTLNTRIKELREAGLVCHGKSGYLLTELGSHLASCLNQLPFFADQWATRLTGKAATPTTTALA